MTSRTMAVDAPPSTPSPPVEGRWTWEQAVQWLRDQPNQRALVRDCYYDDPLIDAARRFAASEEFRAVSAWLPANSPSKDADSECGTGFQPVRKGVAPASSRCAHGLESCATLLQRAAKGGRALDLGAGRGIGSFALACNGWRVTAVEPDPSDLVGAGAIRRLADEGRVAIEVVQDHAESLPFEDDVFDLVYARQALHHARDLATFVKEAARVLRPGGRLIATREHVISRDEDLDAFLAGHPLHRFYGGEHAYRLDEYLDAIRAAGLTVASVVGPFDSVVNYFPETSEQWRLRCRRRLARWTGNALAGAATSDRHAIGRAMLRRVAARLSAECETPGRMFSFVADKKTDREDWDMRF